MIEIFAFITIIGNYSSVDQQAFIFLPYTLTIEKNDLSLHERKKDPATGYPDLCQSIHAHWYLWFRRSSFSTDQSFLQFYQPVV